MWKISQNINLPDLLVINLPTLPSAPSRFGRNWFNAAFWTSPGTLVRTSSQQKMVETWCKYWWSSTQLAAWLVNFRRYMWPWLKIWIPNKTPSTWTFSLQIEISPTRVQQLDSGVKTFIQGKQARNKERLQAQFKKLSVLPWLVKLQKRPHQISSLTHHYPNNHIQYSSIWLW